MKNIEKVFKIKPTQRVNRLRDVFFTYKPTAEMELVRAVTRVFKETEGEPMVTRRAKAFKATVQEITPNIYSDELIVGFQASKPRGVSIYIDQGGGWYEAELDTFAERQWDKFIISEEDKRELREEIIPYWKGNGHYERTVDGRTWQMLKEFPETSALLFADPTAYPTFGTGVLDVDALRIMHVGHVSVNYQKVLEKGFLGIKKDVEERIERLDFSNPEDIQKMPFLQAVLVSMDAAAQIGRNFADKARELLLKETDSQRRQDLEKIAAVCDWVPANPARTFHEALQSVWFTHILLKYETNGEGISPGRIDQYLYPYYERDISEGRITREEAQELCDCFFLRFATVVGFIKSSAARFYTGHPVGQHVNVGGFTRDGSDATNELSYMFIEAMMHTRLIQPTLSVRIHGKTPEDLLIKACELTSLGTGHPSFFNEEVAVSSVLARGTLGGPSVSLEDARNCSIIGCVTPHMTAMDSGYQTGGKLNLAAVVEYILTNGVHRISNVKNGASTGDPRQFTSFEEVKKAFETQIQWLVKHVAIADVICELAQAELHPTPYLSALVEDCIEKGIDKQAGGARYNSGPGPMGTGLADCADSLAAIKKVVFEDGKITMAQLCDAIDNNFEGFEEVQQLLLNAPKYGNDDDYVDKLAAWVLHVFCREVIKHKNTRGGHCIPGIVPVSSNVPLGLVLGALPSGRKAGVPLAEGCSPYHGMDRLGPTATFKSVCKLDHAKAFVGTQWNMRIAPSVFEDREGTKKLADLMRTFVDLKGMHIQYNVVSSDTLRAAQKEPEKYRDLVVKVAGYTAFFVELDETVQNDIISRTEHNF